jgi:RimJ/RimL family protein N-acetyltransferase
MAIEYLIEGERAALGTLRRDLAQTYAGWINRVEVRRGLTNLGLFDREAEEEWLAETARANAVAQPSQVNFTVYDRRDGEAIGTCSLFGIDHHHLRAKFGILLGERCGEGLGSEATRLALDWAFHVLSLRNVVLEVKDWNAAGIRAYEKAGFRMVGRRRGSLLSGGRWVDEVIMDAVPADFTGSVLTGRM